MLHTYPVWHGESRLLRSHGGRTGVLNGLDMIATVVALDTPLVILLAIAAVGWIAFGTAAFLAVRDRIRVRRWKRWRDQD